MNAKEARKYIAENEDTAETRQVNLTPDQVEILENLAARSEVSFENFVMLLMHEQLQNMNAEITRRIENQARRN